MWQDLRYAARSLAGRPLVTGVAALSLALGIGVNSAIFSGFDQLLLRRLPVPEPAGIVNVTSPGPRPGSRSTSGSGGVEAIFSYPLFKDIERVQSVFSGMAAQRDFGANLSYRGQTQSSEGVLVSGGYFPTLRLTPALGRLLTAEDDRLSGAPDVVVLAHDYWVTRLGASPAVLNDSLLVNGTPMTIVGVAPDGFRGTALMERPQVFVPLVMATRVFGPGWAGLDERRDHWLYVFGRLKPGLTREQAESQINVPFAALIHDVEYPLARSALGSERQREAFRTRRVVLEPGARGQVSGRSEMETLFVLLFFVTGIVLLIACANVANLLLARAADRSVEVAIRQSLGASALRLIRLLLAEACLLGLLGAAGALLVARATLGMSRAMLTVDDQALLAFSVDGRVLVFTGALGLLTALVFGLFPAVHGGRPDLAAAVGAQSGRASGSRRASRLRASLATAQIALATALLAQAGLFIVSLSNVGRLELGLRREGLATFRLSPGLSAYTSDRSRTLFNRVEDELRGIPTVISVTASTHALLSDSDLGNIVTVEGFRGGPDADTRASYAHVGTDYFSTVGIALLAGREFTRADAGDRPTVAIVNEAFARKFKLGGQAVGRRMALGAGDDRPLDIEIVGLVRDARYRDVREPPPPQFFLPYRQAGIGSLTFYVRSASDANAVLTSIPAVVNRADANLPVERLRTMDDQIWERLTRDRMLATLTSSFAGLATLLAGLGLYGMLAYLVSQRLREMGIRIALGATGGDVQRLVFGHVGRMTAIGALIGVAAALGLGRLAGGLLFGVERVQPAIIVGAAVAVVTVALTAAALPARRAASVNPVDALRAE